MIVVHHLRDHRIPILRGLRALPVQTLSVPALASLVAFALFTRGPESVLALSIGLIDADIVRYEYVVSGAGMGGTDNVRFRFSGEVFKDFLGLDGGELK